MFIEDGIKRVEREVMTWTSAWSTPGRDSPVITAVIAGRHRMYHGQGSTLKVHNGGLEWLCM